MFGMYKRIWPPAGHADWPHDPGTLYDCEACESQCFCEAYGGPCLHCELKAESHECND